MTPRLRLLIGMVISLLGSVHAVADETVQWGSDAYVAGKYRDAAKWWSTAAHQGHPSGKIGLALLYRQGLGVPEDKRQAYMWYHLAATETSNTFGQSISDMGRQKGREGKDALRNELSESDRVAAIEQAARCRESAFEYCGGLPELAIYSTRCIAAMLVAPAKNLPHPNLRGHSANQLTNYFVNQVSRYDGTWHLDEVSHRSGYQFTRMDSRQLSARIQACVDHAASKL